MPKLSSLSKLVLLSTILQILFVGCGSESYREARFVLPNGKDTTGTLFPAITDPDLKKLIEDFSIDDFETNSQLKEGMRIIEDADSSNSLLSSISKPIDEPNPSYDSPLTKAIKSGNQGAENELLLELNSGDAIRVRPALKILSEELTPEEISNPDLKRFLIEHLLPRGNSTRYHRMVAMKYYPSEGEQKLLFTEINDSLNVDEFEEIAFLLRYGEGTPESLELLGKGLRKFCGIRGLNEVAETCYETMITFIRNGSPTQIRNIAKEFELSLASKDPDFFFRKDLVERLTLIAERDQAEILIEELHGKNYRSPILERLVEWNHPKAGELIKKYLFIDFSQVAPFAGEYYRGKPKFIQDYLTQAFLANEEMIPSIEDRYLLAIYNMEGEEAYSSSLKTIPEGKLKERLQQKFKCRYMKLDDEHPISKFARRLFELRLIAAPLHDTTLSKIRTMHRRDFFLPADFSSVCDFEDAKWSVLQYSNIYFGVQKSPLYESHYRFLIDDIIENSQGWLQGFTYRIYSKPSDIAFQYEYEMKAWFNSKGYVLNLNLEEKTIDIGLIIQFFNYLFQDIGIPERLVLVSDVSHEQKYVFGHPGKVNLLKNDLPNGETRFPF